MIALFTVWTILAAVLYTFGRATVQFVRWTTKDTSSPYPLLDILLIGLCVTASFIAILSLWVPANTMLLFMLVFICIFYWLLNYKSLQGIFDSVLDFVGAQPKLHLVLYGVLVIALAMFCTLHPMMTDTLYYHIQNIMWNEQYAVVPGLANLQPRFGFNSSFFLLGSTFGMRTAFGQYIFGVHTFFLTSIFVWVVYKAVQCKDIVRSVVALLMITCLFVIYKIHITSVTTDFIPNLLIVYLVLKIVFDKDAILKNEILFVLLPIFIVTLKLSCFAIAILPLYVFWKSIRQKEFKNLGILVLGSLFIVIPWCVRTVILSGYLIFPFPAIDLFSFDWKVPVEYAIEQKEFIQSFARYPNNIDIASVLAMPMSEWIPIWLDSDMQYYNPIANRVFGCLMLLFIPLVAGVAIKNRKRIMEHESLLLIWLIALISVVVWFLNAPDFRFIYSFILSITFIGGLYIYDCYGSVLSNKSVNKTISLQLAVAILTVLFVSLHSGRWVYHQKAPNESFAKLIKVPTSIEYSRIKAGVPSKEYFITVDVNGYPVNRKSHGDRDVLCFDCDLPCSADYVGGLEMRGETLQEGYRCRPNVPHRLTY